MLELAVAVACVVLAVLILEAPDLRRRRRRDLLQRYAVGREIVAHTRRPDDQSIRGVLVRVDAAWLELGHAVYVGEEREVPIGGVVLLPRRELAFVQILGAAGEVLELVP